MRRYIALAVVALHGVLVLLCLSGQPMRLAEEPEGPYFLSLWIPPLQPAKPLVPAASVPPITSHRAARTESDSIPVEPVSTAPTAPSREAALVPRVDWVREAALAAKDMAARNPNEGTEFSPAPKAIPAPCVPKKSSMEWNGKEDRRVGFAGGLPFVRLGKRCVVGLGFFGCALGEPPEVNGHLLDDMRDPERATSSLPDPNVCD